MPEAEQWTEPVTMHGEGPIWNPNIGAFQLVDMLAGDVLTVADNEVTDRTHVDVVAAVVRPRTGGGYIVAGERDILLINPGGSRQRIEGAGVPLGSRFNEGTCAPDGSFWCGTMAYDATPGAGIVVRLDPQNLTFTRELTDVTISNGLAFRDMDSAYYVDSTNRRVDRLRLDAGRLTAREKWVDLSGAQGVPDGICLDTEGGVWVALFGGGAVHRYDAEGVLTDIVQVPTPQVTACALGGDSGTELLITTSRHGLADFGGPAGALFHSRVDVPGTETQPFGA